MKIYLLFPIWIFVFILSSCTREDYTNHPGSCENHRVFNTHHPMKDSIQSFLDKYVAKGLPGAEVMVKNKDGWFFATRGFASLESRTAFEPCTPSWQFSITKTFTAVLTLKQVEKGNLDLEHAIKDYLPSGIKTKVPSAEKITLRMLLNHSSGLVNVTELPEFMVGQLNDPVHQPNPGQMVDMIAGLPLLYEPGTDFFYSNTNYLLLHAILEEISQKPYATLLKEEILEPMGLQHTWYGLSAEQTESLGFPDYYFDRYANEQLENCKTWNAALARASNAFGGIAANPEEVILFYSALLNGKVLGETSLHEMKKWFTGKESGLAEYGLGLECYHYGGQLQYGHEGDGIGNSTQILYFPGSDTYLYIQTNVGRQLFGPYLFKITDLKNELCNYVAKFN